MEGRDRWREGKRDGGGGEKRGREREKKKMHPENVMDRSFKDWQNSSILLVTMNVAALEGQPCFSLLWDAGYWLSYTECYSGEPLMS